MKDLKTISSPLENVFDIEENSTVSTFQPKEISVELIEPVDEVLSEEDKDINSKIESVYTYALEAFEQQTATVQTIDPKFAARNAEVAAQYLNIALSTINTKIDGKYKRDKIKIAKNDIKTPSTVNNTMIVASRNDILKSLLSKEDENSNEK